MIPKFNADQVCAVCDAAACAMSTDGHSVVWCENGHVVVEGPSKFVRGGQEMVFSFSRERDEIDRMVFRLQIQVAGSWINVNRDFLSRIPEGADVMKYCREQFRASDFRMVWVKKGAN